MVIKDNDDDLNAVHAYSSTSLQAGLTALRYWTNGSMMVTLFNVTT